MEEDLYDYLDWLLAGEEQLDDDEPRVGDIAHALLEGSGGDG